MTPEQFRESVLAILAEASRAQEPSEWHDAVSDLPFLVKEHLAITQEEIDAALVRLEADEDRADRA